MHPDIEPTKSDNYLLCNYRFADQTIETIKADVKSFMSNKEKDYNYYRFINWEQKENELVVMTMYAYNDIQLPKKFDTIFQVDNPNHFIHLDYTITQAIVNGWTVLAKSIKGTSTFASLSFPTKYPTFFFLFLYLIRLYRVEFNWAFATRWILKILGQI